MKKLFIFLTILAIGIYSCKKDNTDTNNSIPKVATVTTTPISNINITTALGGGNISNDGGANVTLRGVCWSTNSNPTTTNSLSNDSGGTGVFLSNLTALVANTTYFVRAYATNSAGTVYGNEVNFTTLPTTLPTLTTSPINTILGTTATSGGSISNDGGAPIAARGLCWSTLPNPTTANSFTIDGTGTGTFVSNLSGLTSNTKYYVRAYATSNMGTAYGNAISFTTFIAIGQPFQGGTLAYLLQPGDTGFNANVTHGIIAAPSDQGTSVEWGCYGTVLSGADGTALGTGNQNTMDIISGCSDLGIAAKLCYNFTLNGYSDWYLPAKDELNKLYINKIAIGGFSNNHYWSSTEYDNDHAWGQNFAIGTQLFGYKDNTVYVRAVRAF